MSLPKACWSLYWLLALASYLAYIHSVINILILFLARKRISPKMLNYSLNHTSSVSLGPQLVELCHVCHVGPASLACTRLEIQERTETKNTHKLAQRNVMGVLGTGSCRLWRDRLIVLQSRYSYFRTLCVCMCVLVPFFFTNPCQIYSCIFNLKDLKFVIRIPRHSTRGPVSESRD